MQTLDRLVGGRQNYEVREVENGIFGNLTSMQKPCPSCFNKSAKFLLQQTQEEMRRAGLNCHACGLKVVFHNYKG